MSRRLTIRVADLFATSTDAVEDAVRRNLRPSMSSHVVATGAGVVVTLETTLRGPMLGRRARAVDDLDEVLTAVHTELDTAMAVPETVDSDATR